MPFLEEIENDNNYKILITSNKDDMIFSKVILTNTLDFDFLIFLQDLANTSNIKEIIKNNRFNNNLLNDKLKKFIPYDYDYITDNIKIEILFNNRSYKLIYTEKELKEAKEKILKIKETSLLFLLLIF